MSLFKTAGHIYAEQGEEGLRRWESRLTPEQRIALIHEFDQFGAALSEVADLTRPLAEALERMQRAVDEAQ